MTSRYIFTYTNARRRWFLGFFEEGGLFGSLQLKDKFECAVETERSVKSWDEVCCGFGS